MCATNKKDILNSLMHLAAQHGFFCGVYIYHISVCSARGLPIAGVTLIPTFQRFFLRFCFFCSIFMFCNFLSLTVRYFKLHFVVWSCIGSSVVLANGLRIRSSWLPYVVVRLPLETVRRIWIRTFFFGFAPNQDPVGLTLSMQISAHMGCSYGQVTTRIQTLRNVAPYLTSCHGG